MALKATFLIMLNIKNTSTTMSKKKADKVLSDLESNERYDTLREKLMDFVETVMEEDIMIIWNELEAKDKARFLESVIRKIVPSFSFDNTMSKKQEIELVQSTKEKIAKMQALEKGDGKIQIELTNPAKHQYKESKELKEKYADMLEEDIEVVEDDIEEVEIEEQDD